MGKWGFCHQVITFTHKPGKAYLRTVSLGGEGGFIFVIGNGIMQKLFGCNAEGENQQQNTS